MKNVRIWLALALVVLIAGGGYWAVWNYDLRWRPKTVTKHQAEISKILEDSGWASPGLNGQKLYVVSFRTCPDCLRFRTEQFPDLHAAKVDTRVIVMARRDKNGLAQSTPAERSTVAQLWVTRSWPLLEQWESVPVDAWTAQGIPAADGDAARTAVVEASRKMVDDLRPLLKDNGVNFAYPLLVWWTDKGEMRACACEKRQSYKFVRKELGLDG